MTTTSTQSRLFAGIPEGEVEEILGGFAKQSFRPGTRIVTEELEGSDFFLISDGAATVSKRGLPIGELGPGDFFGEIGVLSDGLRLATITADTELSCWVLPNGSLEGIMARHPSFSMNLIRDVIARYRHLVSPLQLAASPTA